MTSCGRTILQCDAVQQLLKVKIAGFTLHLDPIALFELHTWLADPGLQPSVIGQQNEALTVVVEPTGGVNLCNVNISGERRSALLIAKLAKYMERFIKKYDRHNGREG